MVFINLAPGDSWKGADSSINNLAPKNRGMAGEEVGIRPKEESAWKGSAGFAEGISSGY
jgi:hypothetical protein